MPWGFIRTIAVLVVLMIFVMLNTGNKCDLNFFGLKLHDVPVYLTVFFSFVLGLLGSLPFLILGILKKRPKKEKQSGLKYEAKEKQAAAREIPPETPQENSPYGID